MTGSLVRLTRISSSPSVDSGPPPQFRPIAVGRCPGKVEMRRPNSEIPVAAVIFGVAVDRETQDVDELRKRFYGFERGGEINRRAQRLENDEVHDGGERFELFDENRIPAAGVGRRLRLPDRTDRTGHEHTAFEPGLPDRLSGEFG